MNREDIIRMADEADLWADQELQCIGEYHPDWHEVRDVRFGVLIAEQVKTEEREACAKVVLEMKGQCWAYDHDTIAAAIRARGNV